MVPQLIYLLGVLLLAALALRSVRMRDRAEAIHAPRESGTIETYLARIDRLAAGAAGGFFVTASEQGTDRFIQVSAGRDGAGRMRYRFDIPVRDWSRAYAVRIEAEARHRELPTERMQSGQMTFLNVEFDSAADHAGFVRWVLSDVFGLFPDARFDVTWG